MTTTLDDVKASVGPMRDLLARHGYFVRGKTVRCPSPDHDDRNPSASVYTARSDGDERLRCHACQYDEDVIGVARALGEQLPPFRTSDPAVRRGAGHVSKPNYRIRALARLLDTRPEWPFEWTVACLLAELHPVHARMEVLRGWEYLAARGDIGLILQTAYMIRGVAMLNFCTAKSVERPGAVAYAVRRLLDR